MITDSTFAGPQQVLSLSKDLAQILFWLLTAVLAILTYRKASRTILQPLRTEVFKEQLRLCTALLGWFVGKHEVELRAQHGLDVFFNANARILLNDYAETFFDKPIDRAKPPYDEPHWNFALDSLVETDLTHTPVPTTAPAPDPRVRAAQWANYKMPALVVPRRMAQFDAGLEKVLASPLLPSGLSDRILAYQQAVERNVASLRGSFTEIAKQLPEKYSNLDQLERASTMWIHNQWNHKLEDLEPPAASIVGFLRVYFRTDELFKA